MNFFATPQGPTGNLKRAPWVVDYLIRRELRRAMTNGQFMAYARSAQSIR